MRGKTRARKGLAVLAVGGLAAIGASSALAQGGSDASGPTVSDPNPLSTNIPYLAWRGEQVRLVKCSNDLTTDEMDNLRAADSVVSPNLLGLKADFIVEDWSGADTARPQVENGTVDWFLSRDGLCIKGDVVTTRAGLAQIKLVVTADPGIDGGLLDLFTRSEILTKHQFLAGWMNLNTPSLTELPVGGDATTLNNFNAGSAPGQTQVKVTGNIPLGNGFDELGLGASITLPNDWPRLAAAMATDSAQNSAPQYRWDIHDSTGAAEGHPLLGPVDTAHATATRCDDEASSADLAPALDAVDNCDGGYAFSRAWDPDGPNGPQPAEFLGLSSSPTVGPFDPQRPGATFLPDGALTADDAPMPAARVDVAIARNTGGTDIGGVGTLTKVDKDTVYRRDATKADVVAHNLYAPFYSAYIPATAAPALNASGIDGPAQLNNGEGFLVNGRYDFWDIARVNRAAVGTNTTCLRRTDVAPFYRQTPSGAQDVAVYTDEHGEARVGFTPGVDFYFDALAGIRNANGGCDLQGIDVLGRAVISAVAKYPYQKVTDSDKAAPTTLTKVVHSLFSKTLSVFPKGPGAENANARIVVAHAQDVDGSPFANETVCFMDTSPSGQLTPYIPDPFNANAKDANGNPIHKFGPYILDGSTKVNDPNNTADVKRVCMRTNQFGNAAVEVFESQGAVINVIADFTNERILRDVKIDFSVPPVIIIPTPGTPGTPGTGGGGTTTTTTTTNGAGTPSAAVLGVATQGGQIQVSAAKPKAKRVTVRHARLQYVHGKRILVLRLAGKAGTARVQIRMIGANGRVLKTVTRKVKVGKTVSLRGLKVPAATRQVRVNVL